MNTITLVGCVVVAVPSSIHMLRPASRAEKAILVRLAEGDAQSEAMVGRIVAKSWLTLTAYDAAKQSIIRRQRRRTVDAALAESAARSAVNHTKR
ncbi:hypothetical protein ACN8ZM_40000 (plasmid) [Burkholderia aenigmatica]|uniref:hypothetical protein n=1 Tax=Burkholderia aenigmatica TaxID=2015348 RepID=UPI003B42BF4F